MNAFQLIGHVDENHRLSAEVPCEVKPGTVKLFVITPDNDDVTGEEWMQFIAQQWAEDWSDPREDIYTLDDCKPVNNTELKPPALPTTLP